MQRATPLDSSFRAYVSGGARGCLHEADDKQMMQEVKVNFLKGETRDKVERPQPYGFTGYPLKADMKEGEIDKCAEHFTQFMGGNRSFPVCAVLDDRRYRLRNFKEGEIAIYDDQQQKVHIQRDRIYARSQYKVELRVINDQPKMEGHGKDQEADRDQQKDKSRRWSTLVMDKDTITIERTSIDDAGEKDAKEQDEPEQHIAMLSRVFLDKNRVQVLTPHISILWDEEKHKLVLNTEFTTIVMDDGEGKDVKKISIFAPKEVNVKATEKNVTLETPDTAVVCDQEIKKVKVGDKGADKPIAHFGSITTDGAWIVGNLAKKGLVK